MKEEKNYNVYDYGDSLSPGATLKIEHSILMKYDNPDMAKLINADIKDLERYRETSAEAEQEIFDSLKVPLSKWEKQAVLTKLIDRAIEYKKIPEIEHTSNQWIKDERHYSEEISNKVYKMTVSVYEDTEYDRQTQKQIPKAWYVTWNVSTHVPRNKGRNSIAGQVNKKYKDKNAAMKYIEGRKKAYAHLFTEISPTVPNEYAEYFKVYGVVLPGYSIEGQKTVTTKRTAIEVLNELSGGDFLFEDKKSSVIKKLATNKEEAKKANPVKNEKKEEPTI